MWRVAQASERARARGEARSKSGFPSEKAPPRAASSSFASAGFLKFIASLETDLPSRVFFHPFRDLFISSYATSRDEEDIYNSSYRPR